MGGRGCISGFTWLGRSWPACSLGCSSSSWRASTAGRLTAARVLAIPFAVAYTLYTALAGVGTGAFVWKANDLPGDEQPAAGALIEGVIHSSIGSPIRWTAAALWLATAIAVVVALRHRAALGGLILFAAGAAVFAYRHERPWGAGAMAVLLAGVIRIELRPQPAPGGAVSRRQATP